MPTVASIMSSPVHTVHVDSFANEAAQLMWDHDCGCIPVLDAAKRVVGLVTDRDLCMAAYTQGRDLKRIPITSAMARGVHFCRPDDPVEIAHEIMRRNRVRRLPVLEVSGKIVGIVALDDLAARAEPAPAGKSENLARTLAAVGTPRSVQVAAAIESAEQVRGRGPAVKRPAEPERTKEAGPHQNRMGWEGNSPEIESLLAGD